MVALVSLEDAKRALRVDFDDDDELIQLYIEAASGAVINYLKEQADVILDLDSGGELTSGSEVPRVVELATIFLAGRIYNDPDNNDDKEFEQGYLPKPVTALLYPLRDPALA